MLKILTGRAGSGKTTKMMNEIINRLNDISDKRNIILFVPEQMSFQAEYEIAKKVKGKSYSRLQVFSFKRLAYRIFMEVGGFNKTFISDMTVEMMITKIIEENKEQFLLYKELSHNYSFVKLVHEVIKEFKSYALLPDKMDELIDDDKMDETLKKKLHDLKIVYQALNQLYENHLIDNEDFFIQLQDKISKSNYIKNADIYIDGYHNFTTVELNTVFEMMRTSHNMTILFTMDNPTVVDMSKDDHLFHLPFKTFNKIKNYALDEEIQVHIEFLENTLRYQDEALTFLANAFEKNRTYEKEVSSIKIIETENPTSEVHAVARMIFNDVFENKTAYSDYVIYINNQEVYYPLIHNIFSLYNIPVFIDDKKLMLDHSLLNFIDAALEVVKTNFSYEAMFRAIKTEIFMPLSKINEKNYLNQIQAYRKRIDLLENYCLSHGIMGSMWEETDWDINVHKKLGQKNHSKTEKDLKLEKIINETKNEIAPYLNKFRNAFKNATCVRQQIEALYQLLVDLNVEAKLQLYERIDTIDLNESKKHKQVYNHLMDLFDELILVCGDYQVEHESFIKILRTGFKAMKFAIVPPAIDQVMVGTLKRSRFEMMGHFDDPKSLGVKKAIVLGVNENEIPKITHENGLITSKERESLLSHDIELMPPIETTFLEEYFIIYTVLCSASDQLVLSYTLSNHEKKEAYPSEIIERLKKMVPKLRIETLYDFPSKEDNNETYITTKTMSAKLVLNAVNLLRKGYDVHEIWKALYGYYKNTNELKTKLLGVTHKNEPEKIEKNDVKQIFGETITASISSVESYNHCPYAYFLDKGLQLKDRDVQKIEAVDIGDLYHETMKEIALLLIKQNKALHEISLSDINQYIEKIVNDFAEKMQRKYFLNNEKNQYLLYKIKQSLLSSVHTMHYQSKHSQFRIMAVEEKFGYDAKRLMIEPIKLSSGLEMRMKGFIDRIDVAEINDDLYVRIIDYKSGNNDIDFNKIYHKLSLQLFTYLDVVLSNAEKLFQKEAKPAGVLYYHIQNSQIIAEQEMDEDEMMLKHYEQYKMNGYTLSDQTVSPLFDDKLDEKGKSDIVKVTYSKTGYHSGWSKVLDLNEIEALRKYTKQSIVESMEEMTRGKLDIKPVRYQNRAHCTYCLYHSVCKFDAKLKENTYNEIKKAGDSREVLEKIVSEFGSDLDE